MTALLFLCALVVVTVLGAVYLERRELRRQIRDGIVVDAAWVGEHGIGGSHRLNAASVRPGP